MLTDHRSKFAFQTCQTCQTCQTRFEFLSQFRKVRNAFECFVTQVQTRLPKTKCVWPMKINVICTVWLFVIGASTYFGLSTNFGVLYSALTLALTPSETHDVTSVSASARVRCRGSSTLWMRPQTSTGRRHA